jgi:predicted dehydrogenase
VEKKPKADKVEKKSKTDAEKKVRLAFVGLGFWSGMLAKAASRSNMIEIAACNSRSEGKMAAFTEKYGGVAKKSYADIMADASIDGVVITTPNTFHAPMVIEAFENGKHAFVEKPMALSVTDCRRMIAAQKESGLVLSLGHKDRRMASIRKIKELIDTGAIGRVILIECSHSSPWGVKSTPQDWQWYKKETPGGPLCSMTVHHADTFRYLAGPISRVSAFINKVGGKAETDDVVAAVVEFVSGGLGYMGGSYITPKRKTLQVNGTQGVAFVEFEGAQVYYQKMGTSKMVQVGELPDGDVQKDEALFEEIDEFARCVLQGGRPETSGEDGLLSWAVMEAFIQSSQTRLPVEIRELLKP